ncbi:MULTISPECIES: hypothetical protein [Vibrio]|uniref:hypothetical protein n=1 Tax=Vibrio TaxID=662 RepID=UPI000841968C|nr:MULTISPECIES: hypothetical protein [Vibrio]ODM56040.1 hypothetical protein BC455_22855 [Vibrio harveyi]USD58579.1 hypothetical protein J4N44_26875 [Vibrio sp. SCSIO 43155]
MRTLFIIFAILIAGGMVSNAIIESNLPDEVKVEIYEAKKSKEAEYEASKLVADLEDERDKVAAQLEAERARELIHGLTSMDLEKVRSLSMSDVALMLSYLAPLFIFWSLAGVLLLSILVKFNRAKNGR